MAAVLLVGGAAQAQYYDPARRYEDMIRAENQRIQRRNELDRQQLFEVLKPPPAMPLDLEYRMDRTEERLDRLERRHDPSPWGWTTR